MLFWSRYCTVFLPAPPMMVSGTPILPLIWKVSPPSLPRTVSDVMRGAAAPFMTG